MKGALLLLALLVTRELTFETREGRKKGLDGPPDPCPVLSHCIFPSPVQAASTDRFWGQLADQCPGVWHKHTEAFSLWMEGVVWSWMGHYLCTHTLGDLFNGSHWKGNCSHWKGGSRLVYLGVVVKGRRISRPSPSCGSLCWDCLIGKVFCLGCKQSWERVGSYGRWVWSFGYVSSYQVIGNRNLLPWLFLWQGVFCCAFSRSLPCFLWSPYHCNPCITTSIIEHHTRFGWSYRCRKSSTTKNSRLLRWERTCEQVESSENHGNLLFPSSHICLVQYVTL